MAHHPRPFLLLLLLVAIGVRSVVGAPCCVAIAQATEAAASEAAAADAAANGHAAHDAHHSDHASHGGHAGHSSDDPSANPCCSACGPTLPSEPAQLASPSEARDMPQAAPIRALATRPPFPAYDARGPPLLI